MRPLSGAHDNKPREATMTRREAQRKKQLDRTPDLDVPAQEGATLPVDDEVDVRERELKGDTARVAQPPSPSITRPADPRSRTPGNTD